jgi:hypothetical protein
MMFAVRLTNGEDIQAREGDELTISQETSVVTVSRVDRFEEIATRYSPLAVAIRDTAHPRTGCGLR